jgi:hypothetical protein
MIRRYELRKMAGYAGACHRAALCADLVGSNPPYGLFKAVGRFFDAAAPPRVPRRPCFVTSLFGLKQAAAASQAAAATIGLIFVGALSAFFDQDR